MKELIEKMREAATLRISKKFEPWIMKLNLSTTIGESGLQDKLKLTQREIERQVELVEPILVECAKIAASHYENKWVSVDSGVLPEKCDFLKYVSVDLFIYNGEMQEGEYNYAACAFYDDEGHIIKRVTHYMPKELPTPPNSDKNV